MLTYYLCVTDDTAILLMGNDQSEVEKKAEAIVGEPVQCVRIHLNRPVLFRSDAVDELMNASQLTRIEKKCDQILQLLGVASKSAQDLKSSSDQLETALQNQQTLKGFKATSIPERTTTMASVLDPLVADITAATTVIQSATVFVNGEAGRLSAAIAAAIANGATAAQLVPVQAEADAMKAMSDQLAAAIVANTPAAPPTPAPAPAGP